MLVEFLFPKTVCRSSDLGNDEPKMDVCGRNFLFDRKCKLI